MLKLPKSFAANTEHVRQFVLLCKHGQLLFPEGQVRVLSVDWAEDLVRALSFARRCGSLLGGFERIESFLRKEEEGLSRLRQIEKVQNEVRLSRIFLVSNDGSERFYRNCEKLLRLYEKRMLGLRLQVDSSVIGSALFGKETAVKAVLVNHKDAVVRLLTALVVKSSPPL